MSKYLKWFATIASIIGGLTKLIELLKLPNLIGNGEIKEIVGHLLWIGNVCWYIGIPASIIYLVKKYTDIQNNLESFKSEAMSKIEANDKWLVSQVNELRLKL